MTIERLPRLPILPILTVLLGTGSPGAARADEPPPPAELLQRFVGEWDCTVEMTFRPGRTRTTKGTMSGHTIGDVWAVVDLRYDLAGRPYHGRATYGFDRLRTKRYVGTWTDSVAPILWRYAGTATGRRLVVESEGPHPGRPGTFRYRNTWNLAEDDRLVLTSEMEVDDDEWTTILEVTGRRVKPAE